MSPQKGRARVACKLCNLRRVKCDRTIDSACSNCQLAGTACELINSRRGRYPRTASRRVEDLSRASPAGSRRSPTALERLHPADLLQSPRPEIVESPESDRRNSHTRYVSPSLTELAVQQDGVTMPGRVVYMGDSANFKYVLHEVGDPFQTGQQHRFWGDNLQRSMLEKLGQSAQSTIQKIREDDQKHLHTAGVFRTPSKQISDTLVDSFWKYSYSVFPLFDWAPFFADYNAGSISPLLLNAVFMVAAFHCPESTLHDAGFSSRYLASLTFYRKAKALYDIDNETDGVTIVQATILMSNWWGGPMEQKDTWYWLGVAASLAQSLGMHRLKSYDILPEASRKVWRRIWWVLYINDIHHAAVYGRPPHIYPKFCNIGNLIEEDFAGCRSLSAVSSEYGVSQESTTYLIYLVDLISKVGDCLVTKLASTEGNEIADRTSYNKLLQWEQTLPDKFRETPAQISLERGFWPALVQVLYCEYQIVFYRLLSANPITVGLESPIFQAAGKITRLLEDLLISGTLYNAPFTVLPAIFASSLVCIMNIRKGSPNIRVVSEHRAHLAMQILHKFQDTWPIAIWTRHLLECLLKIPPDQDQAGPTSEGQEQPILSPFPPDSHPSNQESYWQDNSRLSLHVADMGVMTGLSPPQSTSEGNVFHYEGSAENRTSGFPIIFPFTNLFEDVGFSPDAYTGSML